jgi:predicted hydrocarbon binding protein
LKKSNPQVEAWMEESGDSFAYCDATCAICHGRQSQEPICYLYLGSIGEALQWATGQQYEIIETHCIARGDPYCRFEIGELQG